MDLDKYGHSHSSVQDINMAPGGSAGLPNLHGPDSSMNLECQYGFQCWSRPQVSVLPSVVTGATDIDTDLGCGGATDPHIALRSSPARRLRDYQHRPLRSAWLQQLHIPQTPA